MRKIIFLLIITSFFFCKKEKNSNRVVYEKFNDTRIYYKNMYKNGHIKDSVASANFDLASYHSSKGYNSKAKKIYKKANQIEPNNIYILNALGNICADLNQSKECEKYFNQSLKLDSTYSITYLNFGAAYNHLKRFNEAIKILEKGLKLETKKNKQAYFYYNLANTYYKNKNYKKSSELNKKALDQCIEPALTKDIIELKNVLAKLNF